MSPAVITLQFDPTVDLGGRLVRWETIALAGAIVLALALAAWLAARVERGQRPAGAAGPEASTAEADAGDIGAGDIGSGRTPISHEGLSLRRDDMLYMVIGAGPGAVIGGRLLHALDFYTYYFNVDTPAALLDPGRGSLSLLGAVVGGTLTAAYVGWLIGAPLRRWLDVAIVPLLLAIGLGKFTMLLGGAGQGAISDVSWALAFAGGGPWRSLGADLPAHPSQVYEGLWALQGIVLVVIFTIPLVWRNMPRSLRPRQVVERDPVARYDTQIEDLPPPRGMAEGFLFGLGLGWWALGRVVVGFSWRDEAAVVGLNVEQVAALFLLLVLVGLLGWTLSRRSGPAT